MKNLKFFHFVWPLIGGLLLLVFIIGVVSLDFFPFAILINLALIIGGMVLSAIHYWKTKRFLAYAMVGFSICFLGFAIILLVTVLTTL